MNRAKRNTPKVVRTGIPAIRAIGLVPTPRTRCLQPIARRVGGYPPHPRPETPRRVKPGAAAVRPPKRLDDRILGGARIPDDAHYPAIHFHLELPEQRLERFRVALHKPPEEVAIGFVRHRRFTLDLLAGEARGSVGSTKGIDFDEITYFQCFAGGFMVSRQPGEAPCASLIYFNNMHVWLRLCQPDVIQFRG